MPEPAKILIVDDDEHIREYFLAVLSLEERYALSSAADGEQALRMIERDPPAVVLLDFMMPRLNGIDVLRSLRSMAEADARFEDIECVMVTGKGDEGIAASVVRAGAADYLSKPCPTERLLTTVEKVLEHRDLEIRKRREEKRRLRMRALLQRILDLTIEGFMLTDLEGRVSFANSKAASILGWSTPAEIRDRAVGELLGAEATNAFREHVERGAEFDRAVPPIRLSRPRCADEVILSFTMHGFQDEAGNAVGVIFRFQDLLEVRKSLDDSLSGASREITRYFIPLDPTPPKRRSLRPGA
jgi:PAS domain S-box-containing protein